MSAPLTAAKRIRAFLEQRETMRGLDPDHINAANHAPLLVSDLQSLLDAFDAPCGSCHPCTEWAAETWRETGGPLPAKVFVDEMRAQLQRVRDLADSDLLVSPSELRAALTVGGVTA